MLKISVMKVTTLSKKLLTRLSEFEWMAKREQFVIRPSTYPKGLFRSNQKGSLILEDYVDEIKADVSSLTNLSIEAACFRAGKISEKIAVLANALTSAKKKSRALSPMDALLSKIHGSDETALEFLRKEERRSSHEDKGRMKKNLAILEREAAELKAFLQEKDGDAYLAERLRLQAIKADIRYLKAELQKTT